MVHPCVAVSFLLLIVISSPTASSPATRNSFRALEEREDAEFEQKKHKDEQDMHEEEKATNSTLIKLDLLGSLKKSMHSIVENFPIAGAKNNVEGSTVQRPANSSSKSTARSIGRESLLLLKEKPKATIQSNQVGQLKNNISGIARNMNQLNFIATKFKAGGNTNGEINSGHRLLINKTTVNNEQFLARVKTETRKKEVTGEVNILPAKRKTTTMQRGDGKTHLGVQENSTINVNATHGVELRAEIFEENSSNFTGQHQKSIDTVGVNRSLSMKNLTSGVLKPGDIEKVSSAIGKSKKIVRFHLKKQLVEPKHPKKHLLMEQQKHAKMFFAKNNETKKDTTTAEIQPDLKSTVTVFGASDIDLETSTPKAEIIVGNSSLVEYAKNVPPSKTEIMSLDQLKAMGKYLKTTRKDLNFRSRIPGQLSPESSRMKTTNHGKIKF